MTPPSTKIAKNLKVDYYDIVAPLLTPAKTIPKSYQTDTWGLFYSYLGLLIRAKKSLVLEVYTIVSALIKKRL